MDYTLDAKPYLAIILLGIAGIALSVFREYRVYGIALMLAMVFAAVALPSRILIEFSEQYMVIYNRVNRSDCMLVYYDEIVEYRWLPQVRADELLLQLQDDSTLSVPVFRRRKILELMERYAPGKRAKQNEKDS